MENNWTVTVNENGDLVLTNTTNEEFEYPERIIIGEEVYGAFKRKQAEGIRRAREAGKHLGRPKAMYPDNWEEIYPLWDKKQITGREAMSRLNLKRTTFYKLTELYKESVLK